MKLKHPGPYDPTNDGGVVAAAIRRLTAAALIPPVTGVSEEQRDGIGTEFVVVEFNVEATPDLLDRLAEALIGLPYEPRRVQPGHGILYGPR